jgi:hypothetical protein
MDKAQATVLQADAGVGAVIVLDTAVLHQLQADVGVVRGNLEIINLPPRDLQFNRDCIHY